MTFKIADRVRQTSATAGTGTLTLDSPASVDRSFASAIGAGNTTYYTIDNGAGDWEIGIGTVGTSTLTRDTVLKSSNGDALVSFPAGSKTVICNVPANRFIFMSSVLSPSTGDVMIYDGGWTNAPGPTALAAARTALAVPPSSRSISTTSPLSGGGDLSADRTLSISVGTSSGTVAAGDDSRITGAAQKASNLSDLTSASTAWTNLGGGSMGKQNVTVSSSAPSGSANNNDIWIEF